MEITFKTKFDLGDKAFYYSPSTRRIEEFNVEKIHFVVDGEETIITYSSGSFDFKDEEDLFRSKEEFIDSL